MSQYLTNNSERKETGSEIFEPIEDFIQQFDDRDVEIRPNSALPQQIDLAQTLSVLMTRYNDAMRLQRQYAEIGDQRENTAWENRMKLALHLERLIRDAKAQGMVHDGTRMREGLKECQEKLRECQEDNWKLSQQLLEYKNRLGIPKE